MFLIGASIPLLVAVVYLGVLYSQGGKLFHREVYPPLLFRQLVEGKTMEQVLEFLGPPTSLGMDGNVNQWIYEPGPFDFSLYPYLPWETPIMNGKIVRDPVGKKVPRRILVRFDNKKGISPGGKEGPRSPDGFPSPRGENNDRILKVTACLTLFPRKVLSACSHFFAVPGNRAPLQGF